MTPRRFRSLLALLLLATTQYTYAYSVPKIIQGGMGVRISSWKLAREVAKKGQLGVISGTGMDSILVRELQNGDLNGKFRQALATFPDQDMAQRILDKYFIEGGKDPMKPFKSIPMWSFTPQQITVEATVLGNYCEVWLAKHDDDGNPIPNATVGINRLMKIQIPTPASLYGAMLADVDYVLMGAGIPIKVPGILDCLSEGKDCQIAVDVIGADSNDEYCSKFSPLEFWNNAGKPELASELKPKRPKFLPIVSSVVLAQSMLKKANGKGPNKGIDGFVVELHTAGGHNAPPRGFRYDPVSRTHDANLNEKGEPIYSTKDEVDVLKFLKASKGLPFWLAGSYGRADKFCDAVEMGATGVQVGTLFALSEESGMDEDMKRDILSRIAEKDITVYTDPVASPTGYPFKVLELETTLADPKNYEERPRACNLGCLRTPYVQPDGKIGYRCPAEPVKDYLKKGGDIEATVGRKCLCNALMADCGFPQVRRIRTESGEMENYVEKSLITAGDDINRVRTFLKKNKESGVWSYPAADVVDYLLSAWEQHEAEHELKSAIFGEETERMAPVAATGEGTTDPDLGM